LARAYAGGGYTDWFLPSKGELNRMYDHKDVLEAAAGFTSFCGVYWSSTEYDRLDAWLQYFYDGKQASGNKGYTTIVRAVRAF
jgi:hypothetical protein